MNAVLDELPPRIDDLDDLLTDNGHHLFTYQRRIGSDT